MLVWNWYEIVVVYVWYSTHIPAISQWFPYLPDILFIQIFL